MTGSTRTITKRARIAIPKGQRRASTEGCVVAPGSTFPDWRAFQFALATSPTVALATSVFAASPISLIHEVNGACAVYTQRGVGLQSPGFAYRVRHEAGFAGALSGSLKRWSTLPIRIPAFSSFVLLAFVCSLYACVISPM